jgi:hypothetical protein
MEGWPWAQPEDGRSACKAWQSKALAIWSPLVPKDRPAQYTSCKMRPGSSVPTFRPHQIESRTRHERHRHSRARRHNLCWPVLRHKKWTNLGWQYKTRRSSPTLCRAPAFQSTESLILSLSQEQTWRGNRNGQSMPKSRFRGAGFCRAYNSSGGQFSTDRSATSDGDHSQHFKVGELRAY